MKKYNRVLNMDNYSGFSTSEKIDNFEEMVIQYMENISDSMEFIMDLLEKRRSLIEMLKNKD